MHRRTNRPIKTTPHNHERLPLNQRLHLRQIRQHIHPARLPQPPQSLHRPPRRIRRLEPLHPENLRQRIHRKPRPIHHHLKRPHPRRNRHPDRIQLTRPIVKQVILRVHRSRLRLRQKPLERHQNTTQSFPRFWRRSHSGDARRALYTILAPITQTAASILFGDFGDSFRTVT